MNVKVLIGTHDSAKLSCLPSTGSAVTGGLLDTHAGRVGDTFLKTMATLAGDDLQGTCKLRAFLK